MPPLNSRSKCISWTFDFLQKFKKYEHQKKKIYTKMHKYRYRSIKRYNLIFFIVSPHKRCLLHRLLLITQPTRMKNFLFIFSLLLSPTLSVYSPQGHAAARSSRIDDLRKIYSHGGVDVNEVEPGSGQTPLMAAVLSGATESVKVLLLELNADPTIPEKDGYVRCHCYLSSSSFQLFLSSSLYEIYTSLISSLP
jgi:hypothetical protein